MRCNRKFYRFKILVLFLDFNLTSRCRGQVVEIAGAKFAAVKLHAKRTAAIQGIMAAAPKVITKPEIFQLVLFRTKICGLAKLPASFANFKPICLS